MECRDTIVWCIKALLSLSLIHLPCSYFWISLKSKCFLTPTCNLYLEQNGNLWINRLCIALRKPNKNIYRWIVNMSSNCRPKMNCLRDKKIGKKKELLHSSLIGINLFFLSSSFFLAAFLLRLNKRCCKSNGTITNQIRDVQQI